MILKCMIFSHGNRRTKIYSLMSFEITSKLFLPHIFLHNFLFTVEMADKRTCQRSDHVRITSAAGYIASVVSEETGCGTGQTPWIIEEQEGQRINITLIDFNVYENGKVS